MRVKRVVDMREILYHAKIPLFIIAGVCLFAFVVKMLNDADDRYRVNQQKHVEQTRQVDGFTHPLRYIQSARTGLCFAVMGMGEDWGLMTAVECTPKVLKAVADDKGQVE